MNASSPTTDPPRQWLATTAPLLAGLGAGLAYADDRLWWLAWFALVPLGLVWSQRAAASIPLWAAFLGGLIYHGLALSWLRTCYAEGAEWFGPRTAAWLAMSLVCAAFFAAMCRYGQYLVRVVRLPATLALPLAWLSMEFIKQYAGLLFAQAEYPWTRLGLTQAPWLTMAQSADLGGEPFVAMLVAAANGAIVDAWGLVRGSAVLSRRRLALGALGGSMLIAAAWTYGQWRMHQSIGVPGPIVCLMGELDLPPFLDQARIAANSPAGQRPQLLLWPELAWHHKLVDAAPSDGAWPADVPDDLSLVAHGDAATYGRFVRRSLLDSAHEAGAVLVLGCERLQHVAGRWLRFNSIVCVDPATDSIRCYDKQWLVPFGEYVPYSAAGALDIATTYSPGAKLPELRVTAGPQTYRFRGSICYDLCFASHFRHAFWQGKGEQVDFHVHCGSEGQDPSGALARVLLKAAQFRAIESRRAIVRNVDHGYSGLVDSRGVAHNVTELKPIHEPTLLPPVPIDRRMGFYAVWGDGPLVVLCAATALLAWRRRQIGSMNCSGNVR